ncbi:MAG: SDR family oxidoreductase [Deltaproteobacteria bacterium]|jgi:UDP-glucose 4-epimerase|nr:SDR family oxidoreductase [Deltaproteobacteria bacterium]
MSSEISHALVTGGAGFIGSHIVEALIAKGCKVTVLDNLSTGSESNLDPVKNNITFLEGDIRDRPVLDKAAQSCDTIFHLAAVVSVPETIEDPVNSALTNDMGTLYVLEAAREKGVRRVVFSSSCAVYGDDPRLPKNEAMNPAPCSPYAVQKLTGEHHVRLGFDLYGLETVSLRYFNVYGPRQDPSSPYSGVISIFMNKAVEDQAPVIFGDGNQSRDFIYVADVVKANLLAATTAPAQGQTINIGTGADTQINRLWEMICALSGSTHRPQHEPSRSGDIYASVADISHAKSLLGFEIDYPFGRGLELTYRWYLSEQKAEDRSQTSADG